MHSDHLGKIEATPSSNRAAECPINASIYTATLEVMPAGSPDPFTIQCVAVDLCNHGNDEVTGCIPRVCYGRLISVEGTFTFS